MRGKPRYPSKKIRKRTKKVITVYKTIDCCKKQSFYVKNKQKINKLTLTSSPFIVSAKTSSCLFFHSHVHLIMDLFDKIIENRCICSFYRHFCVIKIRSLPKQFSGECKQIKIQGAKTYFSPLICSF